MVMPPIYHWVLIASFAMLLGVSIWILKEVQRTRSAIPALIVVGAAVASLTECLWDIQGAIWYPQFGHTPLYRIFNISVPLWDLPGYACYLGGQGYWFYRRLRKGMTTSTFWRFYVFCWLTDIALEVPVLQLGIYVYYGPQPFNFLGLPLWQAMGNSLIPIFIGSAIYSWREMLTGVKVLLVIPLVITSLVFALTGVGWPVWLAMNSGGGYAATYPAAAIAMALSLLLAYMVSGKVCSLSPQISTNLAARTD
ncbi:hypothetical protein DIE23_37420 [Burkholderia sp. Bp9143]|nr:hypothetical protein DIE23_37420 [Burkholderia sp. Bp9143]